VGSGVKICIERLYLTPQWKEVRDRSSMTDDAIMALTRRRHEDALALGHDVRTIYRNRLNNPYATEEAYRTILSEAAKQRDAVIAGKPRHLARKGKWIARREEMERTEPVKAELVFLRAAERTETYADTTAYPG
jgi:hypothetical protein